MNLLLHLLLTHFLSDYPFQSGKLVKLKLDRFLGVFIHTLIHLTSMLVILLPVLHLKKVQIAVLVVYITHNIIDQTKVKLDHSNPRHHRLFYFLDQFLHWGIIIALTAYVGSVTPRLTGLWLDFYTNQTIWLYFLAMVMATYFYDVSMYFAQLKVTKVEYVRNKKVMARNGLIVSAIFIAYWLI